MLLPALRTMLVLSTIDLLAKVASSSTVSTASNEPSVSSKSESILADSYFAIADFDYDSKYIFSGVYRIESSSLFGPNNRDADYYRLH